MRESPDAFPAGRGTSSTAPSTSGPPGSFELDSWRSFRSYGMADPRVVDRRNSQQPGVRSRTSRRATPSSSRTSTLTISCSSVRLDCASAGLAARVLVPVSTGSDTSKPNAVALGTAELMASLARLGPFEIVPIREVEPISLNAARDMLRFIERERIGSVIVVSPLFRSRRSALVYGATLGRAGITVRCEPVRGRRGVETWTESWHGIQDVAEQWLKLQYYRLYVLPFRL